MKQEYDISLSEYPKEVCLVLYHSSCPLCCDWCFNKKTLKNSLLDYKSCKKIINNNYDFINSVCLSGGEPLLANDFYKISKYINNNDLKLKINTSGIIAVSKDIHIDWVNISIKGGYYKYKDFGYKKDETSLINSINSFFISDFVEYSIVYHPIKMKQPYNFIYKLREPSLLTLSQLHIGNCFNSKYNKLSKVTRNQLLQAINFYNINCKYNIETQEFGREEVK